MERLEKSSGLSVLRVRDVIVALGGERCVNYRKNRRIQILYYRDGKTRSYPNPPNRPFLIAFSCRSQPDSRAARRKPKKTRLIRRLEEWRGQFMKQKGPNKLWIWEKIYIKNLESTLLAKHLGNTRIKQSPDLLLGIREIGICERDKREEGNNGDKRKGRWSLNTWGVQVWGMKE